MTPSVSPKPKIGKEEDSTTRQDILRAAARTFLVRGYAGTTMELVASESGAGRRTVFRKFESKKALFDATIAFLWEAMPIHQIVSHIDSKSAPEHTLTDIGNTIADFWAPEDAVAFLRMVISESIRFPELSESLFNSGRGPARHALRNYLKGLHDRRVLNIPDPDLAAAQFVGLINVPLLWSRVMGIGETPSRQRRKYVVDEAVTTFLARYQLASEV